MKKSNTNQYKSKNSVESFLWKNKFRLKKFQLKSLSKIFIQYWPVKSSPGAIGPGWPQDGPDGPARSRDGPLRPLTAPDGPQRPPMAPDGLRGSFLCFTINFYYFLKNTLNF
jgi:hypothetical protein